MGERVESGSEGTLLGGVGECTALCTDGRAYVLSPFGGMSALPADGLGLGHVRCLSGLPLSRPRPIKLRLPPYIPQNHVYSRTPGIRVQAFRCCQAQAFQCFQPYQTKLSRVQQPDRLFSPFICFSL